MVYQLYYNNDVDSVGIILINYLDKKVCYLDNKKWNVENDYPR